MEAQMAEFTILDADAVAVCCKRLAQIMATLGVRSVSLTLIVTDADAATSKLVVSR